MGKFDKFTGNFIRFKIGDEEFELRDLPYEHYHKLLTLSGVKQGDSVRISDEQGKLIMELLFISLKQSYPSEDEAKLKNFIKGNMFVLLEKMMEVNLNEEVLKKKEA